MNAPSIAPRDERAHAKGTESRAEPATRGRAGAAVPFPVSLRNACSHTAAATAAPALAGDRRRRCPGTFGRASSYIPRPGPGSGTGVCVGRGRQGRPRESMAAAIRCSAVDSAAGGKAEHVDWQRRRPMGVCAEGRG